MVVRREERQLPHLLPLRHRQLPPDHRAHLHRSQLLHRRPAGRRATPPTSFNYITGYVEPRGLELLDDVAARPARRSSCALIDAEIANARAGTAGGDLGEDELAGRPGDHRQALRGEPGRASTIDLIIRGICCLRPGVPGLSREYPRQVDRRPLPRAQPDLVLRQWRRAAQPRGEGLHLARPTGCRAISTAASNMRCRSRTDTVHAQVLDQVMVANMIDNEQSWRAAARRQLHRLAPGRARSRSTSTAIS